MAHKAAASCCSRGIPRAPQEKHKTVGCRCRSCYIDVKLLLLVVVVMVVIVVVVVVASTVVVVIGWLLVVNSVVVVVVGVALCC